MASASQEVECMRSRMVTAAKNAGVEVPRPVLCRVLCHGDALFIPEEMQEQSSNDSRRR